MGGQNEEKEFLPSKTISNYKRSLRLLSYMANRGRYEKNPFDFQLSQKLLRTTLENRRALVRTGKKNCCPFSNMIRCIKYYDDIADTVKTGLRISELCGLTAQGQILKTIQSISTTSYYTIKEGYYA